MTVVLIADSKRFIGLSSDTKPTPPAGSVFYETDTLSSYVYDGSAWALMPLTPFGFLARKAVTFTGASGLGLAGTNVALPRCCP